MGLEQAQAGPEHGREELMSSLSPASPPGDSCEKRVRATGDISHRTLRLLACNGSTRHGQFSKAFPMPVLHDSPLLTSLGSLASEGHFAMQQPEHQSDEIAEQHTWT